MSVGTAFHPRTSALNSTMAWGEWSGYFAAAVYADFHDIEYNAIREQAALIDVTPLYKYEITGPRRRAAGRPDRDARRLEARRRSRDLHPVVQRGRQGRRRRDRRSPGRPGVLLDGRRPLLPVVHDERGRARRADRRRLRAGRRPSPCRARARATSSRARRARTGPTCATSASAAPRSRASTCTSRAPGTPATSATRSGSTPGRPRTCGTRSGRPASRHGIRPAGIRALDVARVEAGLILIEADYTSARHAISPEQHYSPFEIGLGGSWTSRSPRSSASTPSSSNTARAGPGGAWSAWTWSGSGSRRCSPGTTSRRWSRPLVHRDPVPVYKDGRQVGRATSVTWGPTIKKMVGFGSLPPGLAEPGTRVSVEWSVEGERGKVAATVVPLPFLDLPRKRA